MSISVEPHALVGKRSIACMNRPELAGLVEGTGEVRAMGEDWARDEMIGGHDGIYSNVLVLFQLGGQEGSGRDVCRGSDIGKVHLRWVWNGSETR